MTKTSNSENDSEELVEDRWEAWSKAAVALAIVMVVLWLAVFARLGLLSVQIHSMGIPTVGALTLAILTWGLIRTLFNPPILRRSRTIAFFLLLATGYVGNVPLIAPPMATDDFVSEHTYTLPVRGEWMTLAGGESPERNYHATTPSIRWGYDFTRVVDGKKFELDGNAPTDWYCFAQPVYAPVSGKVVRATNRAVDNKPGEISPESVLGNFVVIEAGPAEYTFIAHMQKGSVTVQAGDQITAGDPIGKCGNSGRSPEPHVHMHAQDRIDFPIAQGLPVKFSNYQANGKPVKLGMPQGGTGWETLDGDKVISQ